MNNKQLELEIESLNAIKEAYWNLYVKEREKNELLQSMIDKFGKLC